MAHVVTDRCLGPACAACVAVCPAECFHDGLAILCIDPRACVDCAACLARCPAGAILPEAELSRELRPYRDLNAALAAQRPRLTPRSAFAAPPSNPQPGRSTRQVGTT